MQSEDIENLLSLQSTTFSYIFGVHASTEKNPIVYYNVQKNVFENTEKCCSNSCRHIVKVVYCAILEVYAVIVNRKKTIKERLLLRDIIEYNKMYTVHDREECVKDEIVIQQPFKKVNGSLVSIKIK